MDTGHWERTSTELANILLQYKKLPPRADIPNKYIYSTTDIRKQKWTYSPNFYVFPRLQESIW